jgi:heterodisulfide reductase subunit C/nitrate reductase gamma subunit
MLGALALVAFFVFLGGLVFKVSSWFRCSLRGKGEGFKRFVLGFSSLGKALFSPKIGIILKVLILDGILQRRTLKESPYRWLMHVLIYWGFALLIITHALGKLLFEGYVSTALPYVFLRDLFGSMVLVGLGMAIWRRIRKAPPLKTSRMDLYALIAVLVIVFSGFLLKGAKIISYKNYLRMIDQYASLASEGESEALEAYWVKRMGLVSPREVEEALVAKGEEIHQFQCALCHTNSRWAFVSYGLSRALVPFASGFDRVNFTEKLWWVHIAICLIALAILPFTKFLHLISVPLSLVINALWDPKRSHPLNLKTKQMIELDACVHCGSCTLKCAVLGAERVLGNIRILPSEKIEPLKRLVSKRGLSQRELEEILQGVYLCTNCLRCTVSCPSGINLQELWFEAREALFERGLSETALLSPLSFYRGLRAEELGEGYEKPILEIKGKLYRRFGLKDSVLRIPEERGLELYEKSLMGCFACQTCTNVCPVVFQYERPEEALGFLPHQIMRLCLLGFKEAVYGSEMLLSCLTCYKCQEACPQGVTVTDILMGLKMEALKALKEERDEIRFVSGV